MARRRSTPLSIDDPTPFRWDVAKRDQLGTLADIGAQELKAWLAEGVSDSHSVTRRVLAPQVDPVRWFLDELVVATARILAVSDDSELFFIGRSLETVFDCLQGVLARKGATERFHLVPFSLRWPEEFDAVMASPGKTARLRRHLASVSLSPSAVARRERATCLVDLVASGGTLGNLTSFLHRWSIDTEFDWRQVRKKLRITGLTEREKTSPKTWRWQQHADWTALLNKSAVKNVSVPEPLYHYFGELQDKTTGSFDPGRWDDRSVARPHHDERSRMAGRLALAVFELGRNRKFRAALVRAMAKQTSARNRWFRQLMTEIQRR